jgi:NodT family efflux transporter outer membrane factor (OMF) lipoprotein
MRSKMRRILAFLACAFLAGCASFPKDLPQRPALLYPSAGQAMASMGVGKASQTHEGPAGPWWEAFGQPVLDQFEQQALRGSPDLVVAQARLASATAAEKLAQLQTDVHYSTDAGVTRQRFSENGIFPPPIGGSTFTDFSVNQSFGYSLDLFGREADLVDAATARAGVARSLREAVRLTLSAAVADSYFYWAGIRQQLLLAQEIEERHQTEEALARSAYQLGLTGMEPVHEAMRKLDEDADSIKQLEYLDRAARYRIAALLGLDPDHASQLPVPGIMGPAPDLPSGLQLDELAYRPDIAAQRATLESAKAESAAARADFYPNIDLKAVIGLDSLDLGKLLRSGSLAFSAGPALHLPLFTTHTLQARLGMREAEVDAVIGEYNHSILEAARQVVDGYALNTSLDQRLEARSRALANMKDLAVLTDQRRDFGLTRPLDAVEAELGVLKQQSDLSRVHTAQLRARVALAVALGGDAHVQQK